MKNILHLFKRDVQNVSRSVIGLVVVMGLIIVPCLYAWFNIAGSWDPYGNTGNLKIAVVNTDEGYESDLIPVEVNVGENVTATLRGNENFDWVVLNDRDKAIEGVKSGAYYAAVVIPKTFSADMMTLFSTEARRYRVLREPEGQRHRADRDRERLERRPEPGQRDLYQDHHDYRS